MHELALCQHCSGVDDGEQHAEPQTCGVFQKLSQVKKKIKEATALLADLKCERQKLKEKANYHNDTFIRRLPTEVASYIFEFCLPDNIMTLDLDGDDPITSYTTSAPFILSAVCRQWRAIAHSTPRLWNVLPLICVETDLDEEHGPSHIPLLVKEWIDRSGELPLSINFYSAADDRVADWRDYLKNTLEIMEVLNSFSDRWIHLKYEGPSELIPPLFPSGQALPQLNKLQLTVSSELQQDNKTELSLRPPQLKELSITSIKLVTIVSMDWAHLTELKMEDVSLSECFEALRIAPSLTRCSLELQCGAVGVDFPIPEHPILRPKIQHLELTGDSSLYWSIFCNLSSPSLTSLVLEQVGGLLDADAVSIFVEFLHRSRCSLQTFTLFSAGRLSHLEVATLLDSMPTLQNPHISFDHPTGVSATFFDHLAEYSNVNGQTEPRYLPSLCSLTLTIVDLKDWIMLPDIFCPRASQSMECYRKALKSVTILLWAPWRPVESHLDEDTLKRILWLRNFAGVKWKIEEEGSDEYEDVIARAIELYQL